MLMWRISTFVLSLCLSLHYHYGSPYDVSSYIIYAGRHQLNGWNPFETSHRIRRVVIPSEYSDPQEGDDIALVQLETEVTWSDRVQPICLPRANTFFSSGTRCTITGWGDIRDGGERRWAGSRCLANESLKGHSAYHILWRNWGGRFE